MKSKLATFIGYLILFVFAYSFLMACGALILVYEKSDRQGALIFLLGIAVIASVVFLDGARSSTSLKERRFGGTISLVSIALTLTACVALFWQDTLLTDSSLSLIRFVGFVTVGVIIAVKIALEVIKILIYAFKA